MSQYFAIHPEKPQPRLIRSAAAIIRAGGVIAYPTDSGYALGCQVGEKAALQRIIRIRQLDDRHNFTLVCRDLSELATYARVGNRVFRLLKANTPGSYTFILPATREVPRRLMHPRRKTIGLRIPDHPITLALLEELDEPLMSTTLILPNTNGPMADPGAIRDALERRIELVIDGGWCSNEPTTVVELTGDAPVIARAGRGDPAPFS